VEKETVAKAKQTEHDIHVHAIIGAAVRKELQQAGATVTGKMMVAITVATMS